MGRGDEWVKWVVHGEWPVHESRWVNLFPATWNYPTGNGSSIIW